MRNKGHGMAKKLRELIDRPQGVEAAGVRDAFDAALVELLDIEVVYAGGWSRAARNRKPDMGFIHAKQMIEHAYDVSGAVNVPVIIDMDDGYGGPIHVYENICELLRKAPDIAAFHIEDQRYPKRCGHIAGKEVLPFEEFEGKLRAAIDARNEINPEVVVIARTDSFGAAGAQHNEDIGGDIEEAIRRGKRFLEIGADLVWMETPDPDPRKVVAFAAGVRGKVAHNTSPSHKLEDWLKYADSMTDEYLNAIGCKLRFVTYFLALAEALGAYGWLKLFREKGATHALVELKKAVVGLPIENLKKIVGVDEALELERKYNPRAAEAQRKSQGYGNR